jgi:hypothetical protein
MLLAEKQTINFTELEIQGEPFDYFVLPKAFDDEKCLSILSWLEIHAPWKLVKADFYTQYEFNF